MATDHDFISVLSGGGGSHGWQCTCGDEGREFWPQEQQAERAWRRHVRRAVPKEAREEREAIAAGHDMRGREERLADCLRIYATMFSSDHIQSGMPHDDCFHCEARRLLEEP